MVNCMSWRMECFQGGTLYAKDLSIFDTTLPLVWLVLVDSDLRTELAKVRDAIDVIMVPVRQECFMHGGILLRQDCLQMSSPGRLALACVNENPLRSTTYQICICS